MYLYRMEVTIEGDRIPVIVAAENDQAAFSLVDVELEKYFLKPPEVDDATLYEKKGIHRGGGFVLPPKETG